MITITYEQRHTGKKYFTSLKRLPNQKWQWHPCRVGEEDLLKEIEPPILDKEDLKTYIRIFEKGIRAKDEEVHNYKFKKYYEIQFYWGTYYQEFWLGVLVQNKYNKSFVYGDEKVLQTMQYEEWDDEYLGTPESWGGISAAVSVQEQNLQNYIDELIAEYEEVTGEKYERMEA